MGVDLTKLSHQEALRWVAMHIRPEHLVEVQSIAKRLVAPAAKARYITVQNRTGIPWWIIAVIHEREASQRWTTQLGQGDPLNQVSRHVPTGRGPFKSWEDGAYDALVNCAPHAARWKDWSIGGSLVLLEQYNGLGYANKGLPSPYDWSDTDQYIKGKYVADGDFDANAVDHQVGCAALLKCMSELDSSIVLDGSIIPAVLDTPKKTNPAKAAGAAVGTATIVIAAEHHDTPGGQIALSLIFAAVVIGLVVFLIRRKTA